MDLQASNIYLLINSSLFNVFLSVWWIEYFYDCKEYERQKFDKPWPVPAFLNRKLLFTFTYLILTLYVLNNIEIFVFKKNRIGIFETNLKWKKFLIQMELIVFCAEMLVILNTVIPMFQFRLLKFIKQSICFIFWRLSKIYHVLFYYNHNYWNNFT